MYIYIYIHNIMYTYKYKYVCMCIYIYIFTFVSGTPNTEMSQVMSATVKLNSCSVCTDS